MHALSQSKRYWIGTGLLLLWLCATVFAFWWFEYRYLRPFDTEPQIGAVVFDGAGIDSKLSSLVPMQPREGGPTVVHYWDPACPCNRFNEDHVKDLIREYGARGVRFVVVTGGTTLSAKRVFSDSAVVGYVDSATQKVLPPSSPAVAVLDQNGEVAYFGPYSVGALCNTNNGGFVERTLNQLLVGEKPKQLSTLGVGCFCGWPTIS